MSEMNQKGLYTPQLESDACGIGLIAQLEKTYSHGIVSDALTMLENMEHRGACGCDPESGDGAGILIHVPHLLFTDEDLGFELPSPGEYGVGSFFLPKGKKYAEIKTIVEETAATFGLSLIGVRNVPVDSSILGEASSSSEPDIFHFFFISEEGLSGKILDRKLLILRKVANHKVVEVYPEFKHDFYCLLYTSPSPRDRTRSRMPSSA